MSRARLASPAIALALAAVLAVPPAPAAAAAVPPAIPALQLPAPATQVLPNGLRVVVFPSDGLPIVQAQLLVPAGSAEEPDSLPGLASLAAAMVQRASASRTADQLAADLAAVGATFTTSAQRDYALAACGARKANFAAALEIMGDAVLGPRLEDADFAAVRGALLEQIRTKLSNEAAFADDRVWGVALDPHPYGHPDRGDPEAIFAANLDQVRAFVRDRWRPDRAVLAIAGDVSPEQAFAAAKDVFGRWAGRTSDDRPRPAPAPAAGVHLLDLPGSRVAEVRVAVRGPGLASPEMPAWLVMHAALEEHLAGTHASVAFTPLHDASLLVLSEGGPADSARAITHRLLDVLKGFGTTPPSGARERTIARRVGLALPLDLETIGARLSRWQADDFAGLPDDAVSNLRASLTGGGPDLAPVAKALAARPAVLVAGPGARLRPLLARLGEVTDTPPSAWRANHPDTLPAPTAAQLDAGRAAVQAAIAAHGGAARLDTVRALASEGAIGIESNGQKIEGQYSVVRLEPERLSQSTRMLTFEVRQVLDGGKGWMVSLGDTASLANADSAEVRAMRAVFHNDLVHLLRAASAPGAHAALRGRETIRDDDCDLVDFEGFDGQPVRLAIDRATHRVVAVDAGLGGDRHWHDRRLFSEWKTAAGLVLPAFEERLIDGNRVNYFRATSLTVNAPLDSTLFHKPTIVRGQIIPGK